MNFVIDGYNLLYAVGYLNAKSRPPELRKARLTLLRLLHRALGKDSCRVTVVFDAVHRPAGGVAEATYEDIHVRFAAKESSADELIETIINRSSAPQQLSVVSNDRRIQHAASRKGCIVKGCSDFLDDLEHFHAERTPSQPTKPEKPSAGSSSDREYWLSVFAEMENDPDLRDLSDPIEWLDGDVEPDEGAHP
jgi:predicted RNA-binding protein with PIN domain